MEILFNEQGSKNHLEKLKILISQSEKIILCSGWVKIEGLTLISSELKEAVKRNAKVVIVSNNKNIKKKSVIYLRGLGLRHVSVDDSGGYFHAKMYYFESGCEYSAIIGSANLTEGALAKNEELSLLLSGSVGDVEHKKISLYLNRLNEKYGILEEPGLALN